MLTLHLFKGPLPTQPPAQTLDFFRNTALFTTGQHRYGWVQQTHFGAVYAASFHPQEEAYWRWPDLVVLARAACTMKELHELHI